MRLYTVRFRFQGPTHFGEAGADQERTRTWLHSDTLYSAVWATWARAGLRPGLEEWLPRFGDWRPFCLSSAFPFVGETLFFPRPMIPVAGVEQDPKLVKATTFVSQEPFAAWVRGERISPEDLRTGSGLLQGASRTQLRSRVSLDRVTTASNLFSTAYVSYAREAGLWSLVACDDEQMRASLRTAVALLGEQGMGGERSTGAGRFEADWQDVTNEPFWQGLAVGERPDQPHVLLSLCNPAPAELERIIPNSHCQMTVRRGWSESQNGFQQVRLPVRMLSEGSVLRSAPRGRLVDVSPPGWIAQHGHPIYRCGIALSVPVSAKGALA